MKIFIGTSGWFYDWNLDKTLDWYIANSGLNTIELNASFYRFPFPNQIKSWAKKGKDLRWAIKVNRRITHLNKFSEDSYSIWESFYKLFSPMQELIDFFLFQLHPSYTPEQRKTLEKFIKKINLGERFALEPRNPAWFSDEQINWAKANNITWVSIDAPKLPNIIYKTTNKVYLRMHGRTSWYQYEYSVKELNGVVKQIYVVKPQSVYVYFNNDYAMLKNAQSLWNLMRK